jgi:protein TonB
VVSYAVTASGEVEDARVVEADPPGIFDEAALKAVRGWRFNAGVRRGEFIDTTGLTSRIEFKLGESDAYVR